jgi:Alw26I/Eco31I/Esp3I family type II restriction m6 adenine DNA methyltransferase
MPRGTKQTATENSYLVAARRMDAEWPGLELLDLSRAAQLAVLRRVFLSAVAGSGFGPGDSPSVGDLWKFSTGATCPLMDNTLDPACEVDPAKAVELVDLADGSPEPGEVLQELKELKLSRGKKGGLQLSRGRTARRRQGMFFTPEWMAKRLAAMALSPLADQRPTRILDPACGSGRLLTACLEFISRGQPEDKRPALVREMVPARIRGVDIDPLAVGLARSSLWLQADPRQGCPQGLERAIVTGDAICGPLQAFPGQAEGNGFDVVVANPPFEVLKGLKKRKGLKDYIARIRSCGYKLALHGNLNTYRLFLERALDLLAPGGRLAFVLPFGFLMDRTAAPIRGHMLRSGWIDRVEAYPESARVFSKVGQSVALVSAAKASRRHKTFQVVDGTGKNQAYSMDTDRVAALDPEDLPIPIIPADAFSLAARMQELNSCRLGQLADGKVGEVDQTQYRKYMRSQPTDTLLVRGTHLKPYQASLDDEDPTERWLNLEGFRKARGGGGWREHVGHPRCVQTGIVNMEAGRRLVAAEVPANVYLGNSLNYWVPARLEGFETADLRGYLLGLLNSTPLEWRFRLTSSNNNINLYEVRCLPLPRMTQSFPRDRIPEFLSWAEGMAAGQSSTQGAAREIATAWGSPSRDDRAVAMLIARVARARERQESPERIGRLDALMDHLVAWHLGLGESDLERMHKDVPARIWKEA